MVRLQAHIEVKMEKKWFHYAAPNVTPNYILYAALNGEGLGALRESFRERFKDQASSIPGLPEDLSLATDFCHAYDMENAMEVYGECILTADDICALQKILKEVNPDDYPGTWNLEEAIFHTYVNGEPIAEHAGFDDVRILCWYTEEG